MKAKPKWPKERLEALTLRGAMLLADSCVDDGSDLNRTALKVLAHEFRKLRATLRRNGEP